MQPEFRISELLAIIEVKTMAKNWLTDEQVEKQIAELKQSEFVKLARKELRMKYKRRQALYTLRNLEKRGKELSDAGISYDMLNDFEKCDIEEIINEK